MNERLREMQTRFNLQALQFHDAHKTVYTRLQNFEKLKPAQYGLLDMTIDQIFEAVALLENDPQKIWNLVEKHFRKNFFEQVIIKRYSYLFDNRDEAEYLEQMQAIRKTVADEVINFGK